MVERYPITNPDEFPFDADVKLNGTAGTGKSTESQERLMLNMEERNLSFFDVTVCTYRTELAREQFEDLQEHDIIPEGVKYSETFMGTIHGVCRRLINKSDEIPITIKDIVSGYHRQLFCEQYGQDYYTHSFESSAGEELFNVFSYMMTNNLSPDTIPNSKLDDWREKWGENANIKRIWNEWEQFKDNPPETVTANKLWDFDELLLIVREAELIPPNEVLIIDEMHDVFPLLNDVIQLWIDKTVPHDDKTVIVAGDPFQVINSYQGATPEFYENTDIPELVLNTTYRCPEEVWNYAQSILSKEFTDIQTVEADSEGGLVAEVSASSFKFKQPFNQWTMAHDTKWTPNYIASEYTNIDQDETVMFLARTQVQLDAIAKQLDKNGIIYAGQIDSSWSSNEELLHLYNALQTFSDVDLPDSEEEYLVDFDKHFVYNIDDSIKLTRPRLKALLDALPDKYIRNTEFSKYKYIDNHMPFVFPVSDTYFALKEEFFRTSLRQLTEELSFSNDEEYSSKMYKALSRYDTTINQYNLPVQLRTIHESKGMQAHTVALYDGITTNIDDALDSTEDRENECRTWFVGASRSSQNLFIMRDAFKNFPESPFLTSLK